MPHRLERISTVLFRRIFRVWETPLVLVACASSNSAQRLHSHSACTFAPFYSVSRRNMFFKYKVRALKGSGHASNAAQSSCTSIQNTIFALASGHGKCGVSVVRISGPQAKIVLLRMVPDEVASNVKTRVAVLSPILDPETKELIDHGLILWFPGPNSFTGEDVVELQVHGGLAVVAATYAALGKLDGFRLADAGEFSKRAFYNGKLDLTEVEGLGDLIQAETEAQRRQAVRQMSGTLSKLYEGWRQRLIKTVAHVEAFIDFSEDENIEDGVLEEARQQVVQLLADIRHHLSDNRRGERLRNGVHVTIAGRPNVGKSTLLNALCQRPAAIVSPVAGTTRDVVESTLNIGGYPVILSDTAGLREGLDEVEMEGVRRARERASMADLVIYMVDGTSLDWKESRGNWLPQIHDHILASNLREDSHQQAKEMMGCNDGSDDDDEECNVVSEDSHCGAFGVEGELVVVVNKTDLLGEKTREMLSAGDWTLETSQCNNQDTRGSHTVLPMSCKEEEGMDQFLALLKEKLEQMCSSPASADPYLTQERHRNHLTECAIALASFEERADLIMAAEELRIALRQLGKITGHVTTEDVLNVIFKDFCIGK